MPTYDKEYATEVFRSKVLEALDEAAHEVFGESIKTNCAGATDADLPRLFSAIDEQISVLELRHQHVLLDGYVGSPKYMAEREQLRELAGHILFHDDAL